MRNISFRIYVSEDLVMEKRKLILFPTIEIFGFKSSGIPDPSAHELSISCE